MVRRLVIAGASVALAVAVAGGGVWYWQSNDGKDRQVEVKQKIAALPGVSSVEVDDWATRVRFQRSTSVDQLRKALKQIPGIRDSAGLGSLKHIEVEVGPVEFGGEDLEVVEQDAAIAADADIPAAHQAITRSFNHHSISLTLSAGDLEIFNIPGRERLHPPLTAVLGLVRHLEQSGARVETIAANVEAVNISASNPSQIEQAVTQLRNANTDARIPENSHITLDVKGHQAGFTGTLRQVTAMAPLVADLQRAGYDGYYDASPDDGGSPALGIRSQTSQANNGSVPPRNLQESLVQKELISILRRSAWPGKLRLAIYGLDEDHKETFGLVFTTTSAGRAEQIYPPGELKSINDPSSLDPPAYQFVADWNRTAS